MKYLVAPEFNEKLARVSGDGLAVISKIVKFIEATRKDSLEDGAPGIEIRNLNDKILSIKHREYRVYVSFGDDANGEYLLLLDITFEQSQAVANSGFIARRRPAEGSCRLGGRRRTIFS